MACRKFISNLYISNRLIDGRATSAVINGLSKRNYTEKVSKEDEISTVTHTGQVFGPDDYRNVRFTNATRYVNPNFGIDLIAEIPPKECTERVVWCDGGDPHLGHPKVYINLDKPGAHACGYCGLRFIKKEEHH